MGDLDNIHYQTLPRGRGGRGGGEEQFNNLRRFSPEAERDAEAGEQRERVWNPIRIPFTSINPAPSSSGFPPPLPSAGHVLTHFFQMKEKHGLHLFWKHAQGTQTRSCFRSPRHGFLLPARARTKDKATQTLPDGSRDHTTQINTTQIRWGFCCNVHIISILTLPSQIQPFLATMLTPSPQPW